MGLAPRSREVQEQGEYNQKTDCCNTTTARQVKDTKGHDMWEYEKAKRLLTIESVYSHDCIFYEKHY
jgi:hypothetical protein